MIQRTNVSLRSSRRRLRLQDIATSFGSFRVRQSRGFLHDDSFSFVTRHFIGLASRGNWDSYNLNAYLYILSSWESLWAGRVKIFEKCIRICQRIHLVAMVFYGFCATRIDTWLGRNTYTKMATLYYVSAFAYRLQFPLLLPLLSSVYHVNAHEQARKRASRVNWACWHTVCACVTSLAR